MDAARLAYDPWLFVGQRKEIEGKRDEASAAYRKSVELGRVPNTGRLGNFAAYRLSVLTTSQPHAATSTGTRPRE